MEKIGYAHRDFVGQSKRKRSHEGLESIQDDNIKMCIKINVWKQESIRLDVCWNKWLLFMNVSGFLKALLMLFGWLSIYKRRSCFTNFFHLFFGGATARGGPWPPLQYASKPLDPLLCLSIRLFPSFSGPWTRHPSISFLVFLFVLLHTAFRATSFLGLRCLAFFLCDLATVFFGI